jgi:polysaccharide export outer membrane protein
MALDLSFVEIKNNITKALLSKKFKSVDNIFIVVKLAGVPYTILGEVKNPQVSVIYKENPNLFDVIAASGDITQVGNRKEVIVVRREDGKDIKSIIDLTSAESINSPYFYIRPNDIVYVQPLRQKSLGTGTTLLQTVRDTVMALSLISSIILLAKYSK